MIRYLLYGEAIQKVPSMKDEWFYWRRGGRTIERERVGALEGKDNLVTLLLAPKRVVLMRGFQRCSEALSKFQIFFSILTVRLSEMQFSIMPRVSI
jgi:hypothetical protein